MLTFEDLERMVYEDYALQGRRSLDSAKNSFNNLRPYFGGRQAREISYAALSAFAADRLAKGKSRATTRKELSILKRAFRLATFSHRIIAPAFPSIHVQNARQGFVDRAKFERLHRAAPDYLKGVLLFSYLTGWRKSEVLGLRWTQVDFVAGFVRLEPGTTKNDDGREFPLAQLPELHEMLVEQRAITADEERRRHISIPWVFHRHGKRMQAFRKAWLNIVKATGLEGLIPHDFRRSAVRNFERAGIPRSVGMRLSGHRTDSIYTRYAISGLGDLQRGVMQLADLSRRDRAAMTKETACRR